ncbi:MAG: glycosyltransferase [Lachnospiraceae bacterium]|nr:glycosyltransferase [Lachnospiraceae bacterium]
MKKLLFLTTWDFSDGPSVGITKKIQAQIKTFENAGFEVDYTFISNGCMYLHEKNTDLNLGRVGKTRKIYGHMLLCKAMKVREYPFVYSRYGLMDTFYFCLLKLLYRKGSKIIVEIPTYPYDQECPKGIVWWGLYAWDKVGRTKLYRVVDRILTYSEDDVIWGIPTIRTINGVDFEAVRLREINKKNDDVEMIAVAGLAMWHGYDRMIKGLGKYYQNSPKRIVKFHIVGDGPPLEGYRRLIGELHLEEYVKLYGVKFGAQLNEIYSYCDLAVDSLGAHRKGLYRCSTLKAREYAAKGLPIISSLQSDIFKEDDYIWNVAPDDSDIDIDEILAFYDHMYANTTKEMLAAEIRRKAQPVCDMKYTMRPAIVFFEKTVNDKRYSFR